MLCSVLAANITFARSALMMTICRFAPLSSVDIVRHGANAKRFSDIKSITDDDVRRLGRIDLISGGFPCQDISSAGKGAGLDGDRSSLWFEMLRIINAARPAWLLIENVPALRVRGADRVLAGLEESGYTCWPRVVGARFAGQGHLRKRVWIICADSNRYVQSRLQISRMLQRAYSEAERDKIESLPMVPRARRFSTLMEIPSEVDGLAGGLPPKARNALLGMVGNGWCYPIALMFFQWIAEQIQAEAIK